MMTKIRDLLHIARSPEALNWQPFFPGITIHRLYGDGRSGPSAALLCYEPGARIPLHEHVGYEHIFVISGSQEDENGVAPAGAFIVNPPGTRHSIVSREGCLVLAIYEKPVAFVGQPVPAEPVSARVQLGVNGTLMRGLALNANLTNAGARFVADAHTAPRYRLWSIADRYPAMLRASTGGAAIALEIWDLPAANLVGLLEREPPGLSVGSVELDDGRRVLGVLAEPFLCEHAREITASGGWRAHLAAKRSSA